MCSQAIDQKMFPSVLGTAQVLYCPQPLASGNRTLEHSQTYVKRTIQIIM
jgi:hypothetical protein